MSIVLEKRDFDTSELFPIHFIDLQAQKKLVMANVEHALKKVLEHGIFVGGPEVTRLEEQLANFCGAKHVLSCANGTDALSLVLMAKNIKPGDAIFVPSYTFAASAEVIASCGATPVFVDVDKATFNLDAQSLKSAIEKVKKTNLIPKAIIPVDLFGRPADYSGITEVAKQYGLWILTDAAQSFGGAIGNQKVGTMGLVSTTSFFPAKPFGCYGDGGCVFTEDDELAEIIASLKWHGQGRDRNHFVRVGMNSRLDSFQAAVLLEKLKVFPAELSHRQFVADTYSELLDPSIITPKLGDNIKSAWAQYTVILPKEVDRDQVAARLSAAQVPTAIYYKTPVHEQPAYSQFMINSPSLPNTEYLSKHVLSLPMDGYLSVEKLVYIADNLNKAIQ